MSCGCNRAVLTNISRRGGGGKHFMVARLVQDNQSHAKKKKK